MAKKNQTAKAAPKTALTRSMTTLTELGTDSILHVSDFDPDKAKRDAASSGADEADKQDSPDGNDNKAEEER